MNIHSFDLNLVRVFLAIWEHRSVTAASDYLNLTQSAVSHALRRMREEFSDPLFLRSDQQMVPTEAAKNLYEPFSRMMNIMAEASRSHDTFNASESNRTFTVAMSDVSEFYYLPKLLSSLESLAPKVCLHSVKLDADLIGPQLRYGQVDLALGYLPNLRQEDTFSRALMQDRFVCLLSADHPLAKSKLTHANIKQLKFIEVALHATGYKTIEAHLLHSGISLNSMAKIEHFTILPQIIRQSHFAAIYPLSISERINHNDEFCLAELPISLPEIQVCVHNDQQFNGDKGIVWLRDTIVELLGAEN